MPEFTVTLSQEDWVKALNILAEAPFKQVASMMQSMQQQLQSQAQAAAQTPGATE